MRRTAPRKLTAYCNKMYERRKRKYEQLVEALKEGDVQVAVMLARQVADIDMILSRFCHMHRKISSEGTLSADT